MMWIIERGEFQSDVENKETQITRMSHHIAEDGERIEWVQNSNLHILKATPIFIEKFIRRLCILDCPLHRRTKWLYWIGCDFGRLFSES